MNNQFEALNALKIDLHSFFLIYYELETTFFSLSLYIHPKKPKNLILNFIKVHRAIQTHDSWWVASV